ncbi:hypothetical protein TB2_013812 [Malus domestica]
MEHKKPNNSADGAQTLSPDQKGPPLRAVARFLKNNGFSKTLKKFLSEAGIEKGELKDLPLDLGRTHCKYSEMWCCYNFGPQKLQIGASDKVVMVKDNVHMHNSKTETKTERVRCKRESRNEK